MLGDGRSLAAHSVICTIGTRPNALADRTRRWPTQRGRIVVEPDLSVPDRAGVWAIGDCAQVPNAQRWPAVAADRAVRGARRRKTLAGNLLAHRHGRAARARSRRARCGMMATIGHHNGVAEVLGVGFSGLPAWLLWRAYYLAQMPTLRRKLRIWVEWTWGMFFPADITHLRFTRSADLPAHERGTGV